MTGVQTCALPILGICLKPGARVTPRKGARVVELGKKELNKFAEARETFEMVFFSRAVKNIPRQELIQLKKNVEI